MKKVFALFLAIVTLMSAVITVSAANTTYAVEIPAGRVDVLAGKQGVFKGYSGGTATTAANSTVYIKRLTDGTYAQEGTETTYFCNQAWATSTNQTAALANPSCVLNGISDKFFYTVEFKELPQVSVDSFSVFYQDESADFNAFRTDAAFDIYVSSDGGYTYEKAFTTVGTGSSSVASDLASDGGIWQEGTVGTAGRKYFYASFDFAKTYENVTNIVYACTSPRVKTSYYCARLTEIDVYGPEIFLTPEAGEGRTDILAGKIPTGTVKASQTQAAKLTDGVAAGTGFSKTLYFNVAWTNNKDTAKETEAAKTISYAGVDALYDYALEYSDLGGVSAKSFALYAQDETKTIGTNVLDAEFHILVSCDGGKTYSRAYASTEYKTDGTAVTSQSANLKANGGDWEQFPFKERSYKVIEADFDKVYTGVTNVVYACVMARRSGSGTGLDPFYYCARISEFDVYSAPEETVNVTFAVENGTWENGSSTLEVPVKLVDGKGTLLPEQIPTATPAEGYEAGAWVREPVTSEGSIIKAVKFTYVCKQSVVYTAPEIQLIAFRGTALYDIALPEGWAWESDTSLRAGTNGTKFFLSYTFRKDDGSIEKVLTHIEVEIELYSSDLSAFKKAFDAYRNNQLATLTTAYDSIECNEAIENANGKALAYNYDVEKSLSDNVEALDAIIAEGAAALKAAEEKANAEEKAAALAKKELGLELALSASADKLAADETLTLSVDAISDISGLRIMEFTLKYDSELYELVSAEDGSFVAANGITVSKKLSAGAVQVRLRFGTLASTEEAANLLTVTLKAKADVADAASALSLEAAEAKQLAIADNTVVKPTVNFVR